MRMRMQITDHWSKLRITRKDQVKEYVYKKIRTVWPLVEGARERTGKALHLIQLNENINRLYLWIT
jgi:hypothetical protein